MVIGVNTPLEGMLTYVKKTQIKCSHIHSFDWRQEIKSQMFNLSQNDIQTEYKLVKLQKKMPLFIRSYLHYRSFLVAHRSLQHADGPSVWDWHNNNIDPQLFHSGTDKRGTTAPHKWNQGPYLTMLHDALWNMEAPLQAG